jgi:hypothetical protein
MVDDSFGTEGQNSSTITALGRLVAHTSGDVEYTRETAPLRDRQDGRTFANQLVLESPSPRHHANILEQDGLVARLVIVDSRGDD